MNRLVISETFDIKNIENILSDIEKNQNFLETSFLMWRTNFPLYDNYKINTSWELFHENLTAVIKYQQDKYIIDLELTKLNLSFSEKNLNAEEYIYYRSTDQLKVKNPSREEDLNYYNIRKEFAPYGKDISKLPKLMYQRQKDSLTQAAAKFLQEIRIIFQNA